MTKSPRNPDSETGEALPSFEGSNINPGPWQLVILVFVFVMLFGATRIPQMMGSFGRGDRNNTDGVSTETRGIQILWLVALLLAAIRLVCLRRAR